MSQVRPDRENDGFLHNNSSVVLTDALSFYNIAAS